MIYHLYFVLFLISPYLSLSVCLSVCLSVSLPLSVCPSLSLRMSVCLSVCRSVGLSLNLSPSLLFSHSLSLLSFSSCFLIQKKSYAHTQFLGMLETFKKYCLKTMDEIYEASLLPVAKGHYTYYKGFKHS